MPAERGSGRAAAARRGPAGKHAKKAASRRKRLRKEIVQVPEMGESIGPFSRAVRVGDILYIAGTTALSHISGNYYERPLPKTIEDQTRLTLENLKKVVEAAGGTVDDIFKVVIMLKNPADYTRMNAVRAEFFESAELVSTCFCSPVMRDDILVEMEAMAVLS